MRPIAFVLLCLFILSSAHAGAVRNPDSPFGVICPWAGVKAAGIKWVRCGAGCTALDWGAINKAKGVFEWKDADKEVSDTIRNEGADLLVILGYTPEGASSGPNGEAAYPPKELSDWSDFVRRIVSRYKDKIKYWEVWNEPDIGFWQGSIEQYADLLKSAYVAAKKADPTCKVVLGGTAGVNLPFLQRVYENGGKEYFDVMAVHPYQWGDTFNDEWFTTQLRDLYRLMEKWGDGHKEIWLTELGWSTGDAGITEQVQARLLAQAMITAHTLRDANVTKYFWFCVKDWSGPGYGLIRPDGSRKPAFDAYCAVTEIMEGTEYVRSLSQGDFRCHVFRKDGREMLVAWSPDKESHVLTLSLGDSWTTIRRLDGSTSLLTPKMVLDIGPEPVFIYGTNRTDGTYATNKTKSRESPGPKKDVWYSIKLPEWTSRLWVSRRAPGDAPVTIEVYNDSDRPATVELEGRIGAFRKRTRTTDAIQPGDKTILGLRFDLPPTYKLGLDTMEITGRANGIPIPPTPMPVRISDGPVIEFLANSTLESKYLVENEGSGGAPSVRFNGTWTYKFDLSTAKGATLDLCVGAHQANEWQVLASQDRKEWQTLLSGKSNRSWHRADLTAYAGGPVFIKFTGNDQQLSELVLMTKS